jgi:hypothetical protein
MRCTSHFAFGVLPQIFFRGFPLRARVSASVSVYRDSGQRTPRALPCWLATGSSPPLLGPFLLFPLFFSPSSFSCSFSLLSPLSSPFLSLSLPLSLSRPSRNLSRFLSSSHVSRHSSLSPSLVALLPPDLDLFCSLPLSLLLQLLSSRHQTRRRWNPCGVPIERRSFLQCGGGGIF